MLDENMPIFSSNNSKKYICKSCDYSCSRLFLWKQHLNTKKHEKKSSMEQNAQKYENMPACICVCSKTYKHVQSYRRHIKTCEKYRENNAQENSVQENDVQKNIEITWRVKKVMREDMEENKKRENEIVTKNENEDLRNMISTLIKQNQSILLENTEMREILKDVIPKIGNTTINNKFNLHIFLNEQCKDAINLTDFIETLALKNVDLQDACQNDYVSGISNIIIRGLKDLDTYKRPIHCTDMKREILYIKDNDEWEKDSESKDKMKSAISNVAQKQVEKIKVWEKDNPDWKNSKDGEERYIDMVSNLSTEQDTNRIIKTIAKEVIIEK